MSSSEVNTEILESEETEGFHAESSDGETFGEPLNLQASVVSLLFVSSRPLTLKTLSNVTGAAPEELKMEIEKISSKYSNQEDGFSLYEVAGGYQFRSAPESSELIRRLIPAKAKRLSRAAAETLAIIAYKQPVQKAEIEAIRGVDASPTLKTLLEMRLIRPIGHDQSIGHPSLFGTTSTFLEMFGLADLSELPSVQELEKIFTDPGESDEEEGIETLKSSDQDSAEESV